MNPVPHNWRSDTLAIRPYNLSKFYCTSPQDNPSIYLNHVTSDIQKKLPYKEIFIRPPITTPRPVCLYSHLTLEFCLFRRNYYTLLGFTLFGELFTFNFVPWKVNCILIYYLPFIIHLPFIFIYPFIFNLIYHWCLQKD